MSGEINQIDGQVIRLEERLVAEKSARRTRDEQIFQQISEIQSDIKVIGAKQDEESEAISEIRGSIRAIKFIWPIIMALIGFAVSLLVANMDLKIDQSGGNEPTESNGSIMQPADSD